MKRTFLLTLLFIITCLATIPVTSAGPSETETFVQEDDPPIVLHMREINQRLRQLRGQLTPENQGENLKLVREIRIHAEKAQKEQPLKTPGLPPEERDAFLKGYQALMGKVLSTLDKLESSLSDGDLEAAQSMLVTLNDLKSEGHQTYQKEE